MGGEEERPLDDDPCSDVLTPKISRLKTKTNAEGPKNERITEKKTKGAIKKEKKADG